MDIDKRLANIETSQRLTSDHLETLNERMGAVEGSVSRIAGAVVDIAAQLGKKEDKGKSKGKTSLVPAAFKGLPRWAQIVIGVLSTSGIGTAIAAALGATP